MTIEPTEIFDVKIITPKKFGDHRGFFSETYNSEKFQEGGINLNFCQDNHSFSQQIGTLRGLHFQMAPFAQDKLVRVSRGAIYDVAVDIRVGSPTSETPEPQINMETLAYRFRVVKRIAEKN